MMVDRCAAEEVARENAFATITLESIGEGVVRTDLGGNVTYRNGFAEKMCEWFREEARCFSFIDSTHSKHFQCGIVATPAN